MPQLTAIESAKDTFFWSAPNSETEFTGEDPLAVGYLAQQLGLFLLPTLTTRSSRAQAFAVVLYGLHLADQKATSESRGHDDGRRRYLFERWERFWSMSVLELCQGDLDRGDPDAMRGVRGALRNWRAGDQALPLDFQLIPRQAELGQLGAYLSPLRLAGLVVRGSLRPSVTAMEIIDAFWTEPMAHARTAAYDAYAQKALDEAQTKVARKSGHITLAKIGDLSRLTSIWRRQAQQERLHRALILDARDTTTKAMATLIEQATSQDLFEPREILVAAIEGRLGAEGGIKHAAGALPPRGGAAYPSPGGRSTILHQPRGLRMNTRRLLLLGAMVVALGCSGDHRGSSGADGSSPVVATDGGIAGSHSGVAGTGGTGSGGSVGVAGSAASAGGTGGSAGASSKPVDACNADHELATASDVDALAKCTAIGGFVNVQGTNLATLVLPILTTIKSLQITDNAALTTISIPRLTTVSGSLNIYNGNALTKLELPALTTVGGNLDITGNPVLLDFSLPNLQAVNGSLLVNSNDGLRSFDLPMLVMVFALQAANNHALSSISLAMLTTLTNDLSITVNPMLPTCQATALRDRLVAFSGVATISGNLGTCP